MRLALRILYALSLVAFVVAFAMSRAEAFGVSASRLQVYVGSRSLSLIYPRETVFQPMVWRLPAHGAANIWRWLPEGSGSTSAYSLSFPWPFLAAVLALGAVPVWPITRPKRKPPAFPVEVK